MPVMRCGVLPHPCPCDRRHLRRRRGRSTRARAKTGLTFGTPAKEERCMIVASEISIDGTGGPAMTG
eukprot:7813018-Pyramimonas_sp.AAC.1